MGTETGVERRNIISRRINDMLIVNKKLTDIRIDAMEIVNIINSIEEEEGNLHMIPDSNRL